MKSFFTKLGKLLLCGLAVAVVGCTDYDTDIQNVNERVDVVEADFEKAIADLQAEINAKFATKAELAALEEELNTTIADEVAKLNAAIDTKADKAEVEAAIADLQKALADAKAELQNGIDANSAAINGAIQRIEALEATVESLITAVMQHDMAIQNLATAFEIFKAEMDAQMDAVYAYIDQMDTEIYAKIQTVEEFASAINTILNEEVARLDIADAALWEKINMIEGVCTNLNNLIALEEEQRKAEDEEILKQVNALSETVSSVYTQLEEEIAARKNEDQQILLQLNTLTETVSGLIVTVGDVEDALNAHIAAFEAYKKAMAENIAALQTESANHTEAIQNLSGRLDAAEAKIEDLEEMDEKLQFAIMQITETIQNHAGRLDTAEGKIEDLEGVDKALQFAIMQLTEGLQNLSGRLDTAEANIEDLRSDLTSYVEGLLSQINSTQAALSMLNNLVQDLVERVQSLVYVPEYNDHKATINYAVVEAKNLVTEANATCLPDYVPECLPNLFPDWFQELFPNFFPSWFPGCNKPEGGETPEGGQTPEGGETPEGGQTPGGGDVVEPEFTVNTTYVPGKTTLRYKVNSTDPNIVNEIVAAYTFDNSVLSYDLEGVKVRSVEGEATLEIVGVSADEEGYLLVDVLAKDFVPAFYTGEASYSAALVLTQAVEMNNVASEFVNLVPAETFDKIDLVVKYNAAGNENILVHNSVDLVGMTPYTQKHMIPSHEVDKVVKTTTSAAYVHVSGDDKYYTAEELYAEYGYYVDIQKSSFVTSYKKDNTLDIPVTIADLCWEDSINMWNESKFNVVNSDLIGSAREVSLTSYEEADKLKYDQRVGDYLAVVDSYFLGGQQVAVADKVEITKNLVYVNFEATAYDWTLQRALDLRGEDGTPYANTIVLKDVKYDNIYDLNPLLAAENVIETSTKLNYVDNSTPISIKNIVAPKAGTAGKAEIWIEKGYAFATAKAAKENTYVKTWKANLSETTDAVVTVTVTLGKYPEAVVVESEAELTLQTEGSLVNNFKGADALIADAYAALTAEKAGFAANAKANDLLYAALTDEANKVVNDPNSAYNLNFVVNDNKDESFVLLYHSQIKDVANVQPTYTFKRDITTWFGVPFQFVVTGKPQLPNAELVRSTEYAHATDVEDVYLVNLQAGLVGGVYTVAQSDLAFYLNVIGAAHHTQKVSFAVVEGVADIANKVTSVDPLETPINNPLVGDVTAYLAKTNSILTWKDQGTEVKVKATLWAGAYPIDYATVILKVVDPLTFVAKGATVERKIKEDTEIKVYKNFSLTSIVDEHKDIPNLIDVNAASLENTIADVYKTAYGADLKIEKVTVYEKVDDTEAGQVLYDDSKYTWNPTTGIFKLLKDDANELINPIVAKFHVTFTHKVHANTDPCHVTNDIEIVIVDPAK